MTVNKKCHAWTSNGRCRNKAVTVDPKHQYATRLLCRKHARQVALGVLNDNRQLVWALAYLGWITDPDRDAA